MTGTASNADLASEAQCRDGTSQQMGCDRDKAADAAGSPSQQFHKLPYTQQTASTASHVAQIITCCLQSQPDCGRSLETYAGTDSLKALLHCYAVHAAMASCPLSAPVWPAQAQEQRQQHAMLEHVAQAGE